MKSRWAHFALHPHWFMCLLQIMVIMILLTLPARGADDVVYVKKESREATRLASLAASGQSNWTNEWHIIGPFDNANFDTEHPPEKEIVLEAKYPGRKDELAEWKKRSFPHGNVHNLKLFKQDDNCCCYLYRQIDVAKAVKTRISLGSDDQLAVFLNGQLILKNPAIRPAGADQDFAVLDLKAGRNDLLLKIGNVGGNWEFYFSPTISSRLQAKLDRMLDRDFPPTGEAGAYRIETIPLPDNELLEGGGLAFRPDGKLYLATRRGEIWLVDNPLAEDPDTISMKPYYRGLHEILGLTLVGERDLYLVQRPEVTLVRDTDGNDEADEFITINDQFGCSGDYHEYVFGPARDPQGNLFITLNVGFGGGHQAKVPYRGFCLKISPEGKLQPFAYGLRSPNGVNFGPDGRLYYCDNQGEWVASCKLHEIRQNEFYGHMASVRWWLGKKEGDRPEMTPPCVWFPYSMSQSATEPIGDSTGGKFGPFAGQLFVGELTKSSIMRVALEEVGGRMQGACFAFRQGFECGVNRLRFAPDGSLFVAQTNRGWGSVGGRPHGLQRLTYTGQTPFEIHSMKITPNGWDVKFTKPVQIELAQDPKNYFLESYTYHHWGTYGSPEIERAQNEITGLKVAADGMSVSLNVPERVKRRVFHLQLKNFKATDGSELLHPDGYYTMNEIPDSATASSK